MKLSFVLVWVCILGPPPRVEVLFSPGTVCSERIVALIGEARTTILVQEYELTSRPIAEALIVARARGVDVRVVLDQRANLGRPWSQGRRLADAGIPVTYDGKHPIAHNKVIVLDGATVIGGSYNLSNQAERNAENMLVLRGISVAKQFTENWTVHNAHSQPAPEAKNEAPAFPHP